MKADAKTEAELSGILEHFCSAFARRDSRAILELLAPDREPVVVTSENTVLRGAAEWTNFVNRYVNGSTSYSWRWHGIDAAIAGSVAWLLAVGTETEISGENQKDRPYRMTAVFENGDNGWWLMHLVRGA